MSARYGYIGPDENQRYLLVRDRFILGYFMGKAEAEEVVHALNGDGPESPAPAFALRPEPPLRLVEKEDAA